MPRAKPDSTNSIRFELGNFERDYLKDANLARSFSAIYDALFGSIPKLIATTTIGVATVYAVFPNLRQVLDETVIDAFLSNGDEKGLFDYLKDLTETQNLIGGVIGFGLGGPIGFLISQLFVEGGESAVEFASDTIENFGNQNVPIGLPVSIILTMKRIERKARELL